MWRFVEHPIADQDVIDVDVLNDNLGAVAEELGGSINENNWLAGSLAAVQDQWSWDIALASYYTYEERDPNDTLNGYEFPQSTGWIPGGTSELTFTNRSGLFTVTSSFQLGNGTPDPISLKQTGIQFAIEIDGSVMWESLLGGGDISNDYVEPGSMFSGAIGGSTGSGPAIRQAFAAICLEYQGYLPGGNHTVRVVTRNLSVVNQGVRQFIYCEELAAEECNA